jgi:hypothetical protein
MALWAALSNLASGRTDLDVMRQALNVAVLVAGSACSVPLSCSLRAGPAAGTARVQPWWGKVNVGAVAGALAAGAAECSGEAPGGAVGPSSIHALAARRSGASRSSSVQSSAGAGTKGTGAVRDRSRTDFSGCRVRAGSAERGGVMLRSGAGSRISLPRWRDPSVVCLQETSTVAGPVSVTRSRTRYGWLAAVSRPGQGSCRPGNGTMPRLGSGR